jgi:hypothetical protein
MKSIPVVIRTRNLRLRRARHKSKNLAVQPLTIFIFYTFSSNFQGFRAQFRAHFFSTRSCSSHFVHRQPYYLKRNHPCIDGQYLFSEQQKRRYRLSFFVADLGHSVATGTRVFQPKTRRFPLRRAPTYMRISRINQPSLHTHSSQQQPITSTHNHSSLTHTQPTDHLSTGEPTCRPVIPNPRQSAAINR